jgi:NSS family neurotransmitter:Na+ symporter
MKITAPRVTRARWSSEKAFVLATAAAAVGLGNIWRFPYIAGENGGGAFIFAYLVAVVVIGLPIMLVEISAGRAENGGVVKTFRRAHKHAAWVGWLVVLLTLLIMSYYFVVTGWTLGYAVDASRGAIRSFDDFTSGAAPLLYFALVTGLTALVVFKGVKLIEWLSKLMIPALLLVILFMTGYSLTLSGTGEALAFLFTPDLSALNSPVLWALAFGQAFYSLAIGQGYLLTYGSFLPKKVNLPRAAFSVAAIETSVALIAGLMIFPIVFTFGLSPSQGTELAFATLPLAFGNVSIGPLLAAVFFWLLFVAAISSCIAGMSVVKTALQEEMKLTPGWATTAAFLPLLPLGMLSAFSFTPMEFEIFGRPFLEVMDILTANQAVIVSGLLGGAILGWSIPRRKLLNLFADKYRALASHTIVATRYLWVVVLGILAASVILP